MSDSGDGDDVYSDEQRVIDAIDQLSRYGGHPDERLACVLKVIADINDDLCHMRHASFTVDNIEKAKRCLDSLSMLLAPR